MPRGTGATRRGWTDVHTLSDSAIKTYRYLRLGVVGMALALSVSLVIEIATGESDGLLGSISAYYYTPVRAIFVGVLVAVGLALIAIKGREGPEDVMLNLAGMLAPLVALVPTPISTTVYGLDPDRRSIPDELVPAVENNVWAILVLGAAGLVAGYVTLPDPVAAERRAAVAGLMAGLAVWLGFAAWFLLGRSSFLELGHYLAAIPMFLLLAGVATVNARNAASRQQSAVVGLRPTQYRGLYYLVAVGMVSVLVVAVVLFTVQAVGDVGLPSAWLFVVEALLLGLFVVFWLAQTAENWRLGSAVVDQVPAHPPGRRRSS